MERDRVALRAQHEIVRLCHSGLDSVQLRHEVIDQVRRVVPAEAFCFPTADPATLMITGNVGEGLPPEAAPRFFEVVRAYDLTERERDVVQQVIRGLSTSEIAELLCISANTVQDHLKAIFEKVDVRSRRELVARVWAQQ